MSVRRIPSVDLVLQRPGMRVLEREYGRAATVEAVRLEAAALRERLAGRAAQGTADAPDEDVGAAIERGAGARLRHLLAPSLRPVINATGVIVHTNLGRAPLARAAAERAALVSSGYANLEYDLARGGRGRRDVHAEALLTRLTGAEAAVVVNNNAAATLVILAALASGREVIISRGELVEIGGGFRVPDVMAQSGAVLREVGTTNKTRAADYAAAAGERTALILRVHPSNFRIEGFAERPSLAEVARVARSQAIPLVEDLGSGNLLDIVPDEPTVASSLSGGADLVCFSGDKLLGGPQAGIVAGRRELVDRVRRHPLMRALRVDKLTYAALEATLLEYALGRAARTVPVARAITMPPERVRERALACAERLRAAGVTGVALAEGWSMIGGGSAPGTRLPTVLLSIAPAGVPAERLEARLRAGDPPVIARIEEGRVVLDLRTVLPDEDGPLAGVLEQALGR